MVRDTALERRQFLTGAGAVAVAVAATPSLANKAAAEAKSAGEKTRFAPSWQPHDRVVLLCVLRSAAARA